MSELSGFELALVLTHLAATWFMVGLIWLVQRVTYPAFALVEGDGTDYHRHHTRSIGPVVAPPMALEALTAVLLVFPGVAGVSPALALVSLGVLVMVQASTLWLQVPAHGQLARGMDPHRVAALVRTNWIRTLGWSVRGLLALLVVVQAQG